VARAALARFKRFDTILHQRDNDLSDTLIKRRIKAQFLGVLHTLRVGAKRRLHRINLWKSLRKNSKSRFSQNHRADDASEPIQMKFSF
jgi:hypothetical protein